METVTVKAAARWAALPGLSLLAGLSFRTLIEFAVVILIGAGAGCWVYYWTVKDPDRTDRSIKLIQAFRGNRNRPRSR